MKDLINSINLKGMMGRLISMIILYMAISVPLAGQIIDLQYEADSAIEIRGSNADSVFILKLLDSGKYYLNKQGEYQADLNRAAAFFKQAIVVSDSLSITPLKLEGLCLLGICFLDGKDNQQGKKYFMQSIKGYQLAGKKEKEAQTWFRLGYYMPWMSSNYPEILENFNKALSLYRQTGNKEQEIRVFKEMADVHLNQGKLDQAEKELLEVIDRYKSISFPNLHFTYDLLSVVARLKGDFNKGLQYALQCIESMESTQDTKDAPFFYSRVAHIYRDLGQTDKSIHWYRKELDAWMLRNFKHMYMYRDAGFLVQELLKQNEEEEALHIINDVTKKFPPEGPLEKASVAQTLGHYYQAMKQYDKAEKYYLTMIREQEGMEPDEITSEAQHNIGKFYVERQQYDKAGFYLKQALAVPAGVANASRILDIHQLMFKVDSASGNYLSAIEHFRQHKILNDSLFNEAKSRQIEELQIQYETAQKEQDIEWLKNASKLQQTQLQQANLTKNLTFAGIALLLVIVGLLYNQYRVKQRANNEISRKNQSLQHLLEEKEWLLKEIHHRVKNNLQIVMSLLNTQSAYLNNDAALFAIRESKHRMHAMSLVHQKLYQSENVALIDIKAYIRELVDYLQESFDTGHRIHFALDITSIEMDVAQAVPLGLILNEAISNAMKYAFPDSKKGVITVSIQPSREEYYLLMVADNGVGLPPNFDVSRGSALGMNLIQGLSKQLGGIVDIESKNGLVIRIEFVKEKIMMPDAIPTGPDNTYFYE